MKKLLTLATAVLLISGVSFAHGKDGKDSKTCCSKKEGKSCSKKDMKKDAKATADAKTTTVKKA